MLIYTRLLTFFAFFEAVFAAIVITSPDMGVKFTANGNDVVIPVTWQDDGTDPKDDQISSYVFTLCTGPNTAIHALQQIAKIESSDMSVPAYNAIFDSSLATDGLFYIQVYCQLSNGGYLIRYTNRFQLAGMTGSYQASGSGVAPTGETHDQQDAEAAAQKISASFSVPYTEQTGSTRYAPMQMQPDSTITATAWSRRFPSSAVTYYSTFHSSPNVLSTVTPGWSYTMNSFFNYATPAPFPSEVGWYPASAKLVSASLDPNLGNSKRKLKKRRWVD
jgi:hypothetical protein